MENIQFLNGYFYPLKTLVLTCTRRKSIKHLLLILFLLPIQETVYAQTTTTFDFGTDRIAPCDAYYSGHHPFWNYTHGDPIPQITAKSVIMENSGKQTSNSQGLFLNYTFRKNFKYSITINGKKTKELLLIGKIQQNPMLSDANPYCYKFQSPRSYTGSSLDLFRHTGETLFKNSNSFTANISITDKDYKGMWVYTDYANRDSAGAIVLNSVTITERPYSLNQVEFVDLTNNQSYQNATEVTYNLSNRPSKSQFKGVDHVGYFRGNPVSFNWQIDVNAGTWTSLDTAKGQHLNLNFTYPVGITKVRRIIKFQVGSLYAYDTSAVFTITVDKCKRPEDQTSICGGRTIYNCQIGAYYPLDRILGAYYNSHKVSYGDNFGPAWFLNDGRDYIYITGRPEGQTEISGRMKVIEVKEARLLILILKTIHFSSLRVPQSLQ